MRDQDGKTPLAKMQSTHEVFYLILCALARLCVKLPKRFSRKVAKFCRKGAKHAKCFRFDPLRLGVFA